ncbi:MAG: NAD-dependent dehydratase [Candidatus Omnitrophica bacterium CG_4_8_14_3_um_filter_43_15]|nr:MAG: NAD-dependent dehydratase [Candidatus Omnitrophica bacterium CG_4_8_14_3_um_filter_43_15]
MQKNKKILITGATGFLGANIARHFLKKGDKVYIFTRKISDKWRIRNILKDVSEYSVDLEDSVNLNKIIKQIKPHIIIHTAVYGGYSFQNDAAKIVAANFTGTVNLISALKDIKFELFINTGSSSEYGVKPKLMREIDLLEPISEYGSSKAAATLYCQAISKKENKPIVTLRLFSPYGYYEEKRRLISSVILSCLKLRNPRLSSPDSVRDFIFIEDVIDAYSKIIDNKDKVKGEVFNIGSGAQYTVGEVVRNIIKITGDRVNPQWGKIINSRNEPECWQADISKIKKILNWEPKYSLSQGLEKDINWFKENITLYK